jgi:hypothetical protein
VAVREACGWARGGAAGGAAVGAVRMGKEEQARQQGMR